MSMFCSSTIHLQKAGSGAVTRASFHVVPSSSRPNLFSGD
jgi:hypothetical protein